MLSTRRETEVWILFPAYFVGWSFSRPNGLQSKSKKERVTDSQSSSRGVIAEKDDRLGRWRKGDIVRVPSAKISKDYQSINSVYRLLDYLVKGGMQATLDLFQLKVNAHYICRHVGIPTRDAADRSHCNV